MYDLLASIKFTESIPQQPSGEATERRLVLFSIFLIVIGLGIDSVQFSKQYFDGRLITNILFAGYFCLMYASVSTGLKRLMLVMLPLSYLGELLCSEVFDMYAYKGGSIPLYVPFGHALVFASGYIMARTNFIKQREKQLKAIFPIVFSLLFLGALALFNDVFSLLFGIMFFLVLKRKRGDIMYYCLGCCALFVEFVGTPFGCWKWAPEIFNFLPSANPPVGAVFIYVGGDAILSKILFLWDRRKPTKRKMFTAPQNTDLLLSEAQKEQLYTKLVEQLNKDFALANEGIDFETNISPINLKRAIQEKIYMLIQHKFAEYLNLLYIIDVPEKDIKSLDGSDISELAEQVAFQVLKREWQKVWFRNRY